MHQTSTHRIRVDLAYDGTDYHGWATQPGLPTIQEAVEQGLATIFRKSVATTVAGRTDAGVHARRQVLHFDISQHLWQQLSGYSRQRPPEAALVSKLNGVLGRHSGAIRILAARIAPQGFDARFSPLSRSYRYRISNGHPDPLVRHFTYHHRKPLDAQRMIDEVADLQGLYDFGSFCKPRPGATTIRTLQQFDVHADADLITVTLTADAFCHHMVRALVGGLLQVGDGSKPPGWIHHRLANPTRDSNMVVAQAHGLILARVNYPDDEFVSDRADQTRARRDVTSRSCD